MLDLRSDVFEHAVWLNLTDFLWGPVHCVTSFFP